jgi:hypothetical protein
MVIDILEAICSYETLSTTYLITWCYNPQKGLRTTDISTSNIVSISEITNVSVLFVVFQFLGVSRSARRNNRMSTPFCPVTGVNSTSRDSRALLRICHYELALATCKCVGGLI